MDLQLNNKVALVFGASAGLGSAIAETLAAEGARIALASLPSDSLTAAAERVGAITDAIAVPWDLADLSAIGPNIATVERQIGPIEIIVNMTGGPPPTPASGQRPEDWTRFFTSMVARSPSSQSRTPCCRGCGNADGAASSQIPPAVSSHPFRIWACPTH